MKKITSAGFLSTLFFLWMPYPALAESVSDESTRVLQSIANQQLHWGMTQKEIESVVSGVQRDSDHQFSYSSQYAGESTRVILTLDSQSDKGLTQACAATTKTFGPGSNIADFKRVTSTFMESMAAVMGQEGSLSLHTCFHGYDPKGCSWRRTPDFSADKMWELIDNDNNSSRQTSFVVGLRWDANTFIQGFGNFDETARPFPPMKDSGPVVRACASK